MKYTFRYSGVHGIKQYKKRFYRSSLKKYPYKSFSCTLSEEDGITGHRSEFPPDSSGAVVWRHTESPTKIVLLLSPYELSMQQASEPPAANH